VAAVTLLATQHFEVELARDVADSGAKKVARSREIQALRDEGVQAGRIDTCRHLWPAGWYGYRIALRTFA
jgi:hypothetical protein